MLSIGRGKGWSEIAFDWFKTLVLENLSLQFFKT